jgi:hypothetical protein
VTDGKGLRQIPRADRDHGCGLTVREEGPTRTNHLPMLQAGPAAHHLTGHLEQQPGRPRRVVIGWNVHHQLLVHSPAIRQAEMTPRQPDGHQGRDPAERYVRAKPRHLNAFRRRIIASASARDEPEERLQVPNQPSHSLIIPDRATTKAPPQSPCAGSAPTPSLDHRTVVSTSRRANRWPSDTGRPDGDRLACRSPGSIGLDCRILLYRIKGPRKRGPRARVLPRAHASGPRGGRGAQQLCEPRSNAMPDARRGSDRPSRDAVTSVLNRTTAQSRQAASASSSGR